MRVFTTSATALLLVAVVLILLEVARAEEGDKIVGAIPRAGGPAAGATTAAANPLDKILGTSGSLSTPLEWAKALIDVTKSMDRKKVLTALVTHILPQREATSVFLT